MDDNRDPLGISPREALILAGTMIQISTITLVIAGVALGAGLLLDYKLGTKPWLTMTFILGSIPISLWAVLRTALSVVKKEHTQFSLWGLAAKSEEEKSEKEEK